MKITLNIVLTVIPLVIFAISCKEEPAVTANGPEENTNRPAKTTPYEGTGLLPDPPNKPASVKPSKATLDQVPLVKISLKNQKGASAGHCTGTLIYETLVLTAAHCFYDYDGKEQLFFPQKIQVKKNDGSFGEAKHELFWRASIEDGDYLDIALIKLKDPVKNSLHPINIGKRPASFEYEFKPDTLLMSFGFTSNKWEERTSMKTSVISYSQGLAKELKAKFKKWVLPTKRSTAYGGDSGGPLLLEQNKQWLIVGVLQGYKMEGLYTAKDSLAFTWADTFITKACDILGKTDCSVFPAHQEGIDLNLLEKTK